MNDKHSTDLLHPRWVAETEERHRLAREIHDTLVQGLTGIGLQVDLALATLQENPARTERALRRALDLVRENLDQARRSMMELRAPMLRQEPLAEGLERLVRQVAADSCCGQGFFRLQGEPAVLPEAVELALFRIAQEALHNALKHAAARTLTLTLTYRPETVTLCVVDDGIGFTPLAVPIRGSREGGFGLTAMRERALALGGWLDVESQPGKGSQVTAVIPLREGKEGAL